MHRTQLNGYNLVNNSNYVCCIKKLILLYNFPDYTKNLMYIYLYQVTRIITPHG